MFNQKEGFEEVLQIKMAATQLKAVSVNGKIVYLRPEPHDVEVIQELSNSPSRQRSSLGPDRRPLRQIPQGRWRSSATPYNHSKRTTPNQDPIGNFKNS